MGMVKLILSVSSLELPDILRLPAITRLVDAGRVSIQTEEQFGQRALSAEGTTRQRGKDAFEERAAKHGIDVRTPAELGSADYEIVGPAGARPVRLICSEGARISLRREWAEPVGLVLAYVWLLPGRTRIFLMTFQEASDVLGRRALASSSFRDSGYYTTVCTAWREQAMERFEDRWHQLGK